MTEVTFETNLNPEKGGELDRSHLHQDLGASGFRRAGRTGDGRPVSCQSLPLHYSCLHTELSNRFLYFARKSQATSEGNDSHSWESPFHMLCALRAHAISQIDRQFNFTYVHVGMFKMFM